MPPGLRLAVCVSAAAGVLWALTGRALEYPAFGAVLLELLVSAWLFPAARLQRSSPLSPGNWAWLLFHVQLVAAPLLGMGFGFAQETFPHLPPPGFINAAMLLSALAHFCFALGAQLGARRPAKGAPAPRFSGGFHGALAAAFLLLGAVGLWLTFGGLAGYLQYVTVPETHFLMSEAPTTLGRALGTFLRHFFPFGLVLFWCGGIDRRERRGWYAVPTLLLLPALIATTANYNRASLVGPVLAVLAAYSLTVRRLSGWTMALAGAGILMAALAFGSYRIDNLYGAGAPVHHHGSRWEELNDFVQVYGQGPQFLGFLLERTRNESLHLGSSAFASVMYPLPVVGKPFRDSSGVTLYNQLVYGAPGVVDQIIPASGELFLNFHLPGVAIFFALLGFAVQRTEQHFQAARSAFSAVAAFFLGMWLSSPIAGSLAVISQILIYSFWPIYAYFGLRAAFGACLRAPLRPALAGAPR